MRYGTELSHVEFAFLRLVLCNLPQANPRRQTVGSTVSEEELEATYSPRGTPNSVLSGAKQSTPGSWGESLAES